MSYVITSRQGRTVRVIDNRSAAEAYVRTLIRTGVSYSIESPQAVTVTPWEHEPPAPR